MKKFLSAMSLILGLGLATAQQTAPAKSAPAHPPVKATTAKAAQPAEVKAAKPAMDAKAAKPAQPAAKMKKDGTPDKRYKANK